MAFTVFLLGLGLLHLTGSEGVSKALSVHQSPPFIIKRVGESATGEFHCSHSIPNYERVLWYKQDGTQAFRYLGYLNLKHKYLDESVKGKISFDGDGGSASTLTVFNVTLEDSGVYFCSTTQGYTEAYFGAGTKLTVLDPKRNITAPQVAVFPPSPKECQRQKHINKTLVCVARRFYPDHVTVSWEVDLKVRSAVVTTDSKALMDGDYYTLSSRLTVPATDWGTAGRNFTCIVSFFDGTQTVTVSDSVFGEKIKKGTISRRRYEKITQGAKLSYGVLTAKSCVYGAFVALLLWRLQRLAGKQIDGEVN